MGSKRYKDKGHGRDEQEIEELQIKIFDSNEGKSCRGTNKKNQRNLISYNSDGEFEGELELHSTNMVEVRS